MKHIKRIFALLTISTLIFAQLGISAATTTPKYTILEEELYSFRSVFEQVVEGLDANSLEEAFFDGYDWYVTNTLGAENTGPWSTSENFKYRTTVTSEFEAITAYSHEDFKNHLAMIEWNVADKSDKNVYFANTAPWTTYSITCVNFIAPQDGKIVLLDELTGTIDACDADGPFEAFAKGDAKVEISILKNDVKIWPEDSEFAVVDKEHRSIPFPDIGIMPVYEDDVITIQLKSYSAQLSGWGKAVVKMNPAVGYTQISGKGDEGAGTMDIYFKDPSPDKKPQNNDNYTASPWIWLGISVGTAAIITATVAVTIIILKKKKKS